MKGSAKSPEEAVRVFTRRDSKLLARLGEFADEQDVRLYVVGGYVRDRLLGLPAKKELDFTVIGDAVAFAERLATHLSVRKPVIFARFGTAMVPYRGYRLDFVSARKESYRSHSRKPRVISAGLEADLARRDFTVNAMAASLNEAEYGQLVDLFGGVTDLKARTLRTPLEPERTFSEDPLRILRAIRFAAQLEFGIEIETRRALERMVERLSIISQERITEEILKLLATRKPSVGLRLMYLTGVMDVVLPEISRLAGVEQIGPHHHKDVFEHTLMVVDKVAEMSEYPVLRLAALVHDVAKPKTKRFAAQTGWTFHGHEDVGARMMKAIGRRMRLSEDMTAKLGKLVVLHMRPINLTREEVTDSAVRRLIVDAGEDLSDLLTLCRADITSAKPNKVKKYLAQFDILTARIDDVIAKDDLRAFQSPVRGEEIMAVCNIPPGPLVGRIKKALEEAILDGQVPNEHDAVLELLHEIKSQFIGSESHHETPTADGGTTAGQFGPGRARVPDHS
ncbi:CCA tRNA nucleotidyltransferase [bacterium]|nr:CCA tRNA nucleotidyltransferase [bacterium]